ncbi:MAG: YkgJ family cysteine cluster protein, partial [Nanoarchaeota archaeon]|nr:YkgJ family cysteine cluster protein [Nanoarchaeota archaeon]
KLIKKSPSMAFLPERELDNMFNDLYAELKKSHDGYCVFLNKENMLCSIYEERPQVCKDYTTDRCDKIRVIEL